MATTGAAEPNPASTEQPSAILVQPIHDAQVIPGDDGKDHVEYELMVVNVYFEPATLTSMTVLDSAGKELGRIDGDTLAAATQVLLTRRQHPRSPRLRRLLSMWTWPWNRAPHRSG